MAWATKLKRRGPERRRAASSCNAFANATFSSFFYSNTFLSSRGEDGQQMHTRGSAIGAATRIDPDISPSPPLILTRGQKERFLILSLNNSRAAVVWKPSKISPQFLNCVCAAITLQCPHQTWCRTFNAFFKSPMLRLEHPLKRTKNVSLIVNNSAVNRPISLKFGAYIDQMMPTYHVCSRSKGQRSRSQCDVGY